MTGCRGVPRTTACSMITQLAPTSTGPPSSVSTAPCSTQLPDPTRTCPLSTAVGAIQASGATEGLPPRCLISTPPTVPADRRQNHAAATRSFPETELASRPELPAGAGPGDGGLCARPRGGRIKPAGRAWEEAGVGVVDVLSGRLAAGEVVIVDGGMGTQLQAEGVPMDGATWCARANLEQPGVVRRVHEAYIRAGAQVIIANTFAASRAVLEPAGLGGRVAEANVNAVGAALAAREAAADGPVAVAGSMSSFCPAVMAAGAT